ncbi:MAG: carboxypeptidase-like regulatory domain-containing protein, partial [Candidatus Thermoplasmatota archaeon]|nr:carboxypeptidase-like regulatory domain-containing protein [Candidatus Thermoplasmatota archaeon]
IWAFTYQGEKKTLEGEVVSFKFDEAGEYQIILSVFDLADNYGDDKVVINVVDTGILKGTVRDKDGDPVPGATFEVLASDGKTYTATTLSDGSFSLEIPHGPFSWKIMKDGYKPITGTGSINALEEKDLDLSGSALEKEEGSSFPIMLVVIPAIIILLLIVGIVLFLVLRKKKEEPQEETEKIEVEKEEPESSLEGSIPPEDSEFTQPPPVMEEDEEEIGEEADPFSEEGSRDLRDLLEDDSVSG